MGALTHKERLLGVLVGEEVDRPPFICPGGMMNMVVTDVMDAVGDSWPAAHHDAASMARLSGATRELCGVENLGAPFCMTIEAEGMGAPIEFGTRETEPRVAAYPIQELAQVDQLAAFDPRDGRANVVVDAVRLMAAGAPDAPVIANLTGPISLATSLIEPLIFYRAMRQDKAAAHALLELVTGAAIAFGDAMVDAGADVVCIADPSGTGELIGGKAFSEFALPYLNEIARHFAGRETPTIAHICGRVRSLGDTLAQLETAVVSVDSCVSMSALKELVPAHAVMGNVSTYLLEYGEIATLASVARSRVEAGVDIVSPACGVGARTPARNIRAVAEAVAGANTGGDTASRRAS